jgi:hypothetical protein
MKLKSFCTTKDMASKLERSPTEWEKTCTSYIRQETDNQNIRKLKKLNSQKINNPMKKWANELNRAFSKEEVQMAKKKTHENILTIPGHKGNANQNHIKISPHPC